MYKSIRMFLLSCFYLLSCTSSQDRPSVPNSIGVVTAKPPAPRFDKTSPGAVPSQQAPRISHIMPQLIRPSETLTIIGENLSSLLKVEIGQTPALILQATDKMVQVSVSDQARSGIVRLTTTQGASESAQWLVIISEAAALALLETKPAQGVSGDIIELSGLSFDASPNQNQVRFNGLEAGVLGLENGKLRLTVPSGATTGLITVQIAQKLFVSRFPFVILDAPTISEISPLTGGPGTLVTIFGRALGDEPQVLFNGVSAELVSKEFDRLVVRVPANVISGPLRVKTTKGQAFSPSSFRVGTAPQLTQISPVRGSVGQIITLSGLNLDKLAPEAIIRFNGVTARITASTATELIVSVPAAASSGPVVLALDATTEIFAGQFEIISSNQSTSTAVPSVDKAQFEIEL